MRKTTIAAALIAVLALSGCEKTQNTSMKPEAGKDVAQTSTVNTTTQNTQGTIQASDKTASTASTQPAKAAPTTGSAQSTAKAPSSQPVKSSSAANSTQNNTTGTAKAPAQQTTTPAPGRVVSSQTQPANPGTHVSQGITTNNVKFTVISDVSVLPEGYQQQINNLRTQRGYFYSQNGDNFIMTFLSGERNTGGYGIKVLSVEDIEGITKVIVEETSPAEGMIVPQMITYPAVTISLPLVHDRVEVVNTKGEKFELVTGVQQ